MKHDDSSIVLIRGCSDGSLGSALAHEMHARGCRVFATARNVKKLSTSIEAGIETLELDVTSPESLASCVKQLSQITDRRLDVLINNSGMPATGALIDTKLTEARAVYDLNVFAPIEVTQAFLPLLLNSKRQGGALVVNHTSVASIAASPFQGVYSSSKAALTSLTDALRAELAVFGIQVIELKSGATVSNMVFGPHSF